MSETIFKELVGSGVEPVIASQISRQLDIHAEGLDLSKPKDTEILWFRAVDEIIPNIVSNEAKKAIHDLVYKNWNHEDNGNPPIIKLSENQIKQTTLYKEIQRLGLKNEDEYQNYSVTNSTEFWSDACKATHIQEAIKNGFEITPETIVDATNPKNCKWLKGAKLNIADAMLWKAKDSKTQNDIALKYQKENSGEIIEYTYKQLDEMSNQFADALVKKGYKKDDAIGFCTAGMNPESIAAQLGIMKMGGTIVNLLPNLQLDQLQARIDQIPNGLKGIVTQDFMGIEKTFPLYENIKKLKPEIDTIVIEDKKLPEIDKRKNDISFSDFVSGKDKSFKSVEMDPDDNISVIFSSGTTGIPKAIPWTFDCFVKSSNDARLHMDVKSGETLCWPSNFGWMMGSFGQAAAFMNGATLAVFEGNTISKKYAKFVQNTEVTVLGSVPEICEKWQQTKCMEDADLSKIKRFASSGEASNPDNYLYVASLFNFKAVFIEYSGGTEIGGAINTAHPTKKIGISEFNTPAYGTKIYFAADEKDPKVVSLKIVVSNEDGYVTPMGISRRLLNEKNLGKTHEEIYYPGNKKLGENTYIRTHGDALRLFGKNLVSGIVKTVKDLSFRSDGRDDDSFNVNGVKTSSMEMRGLITTGMSKLAQENAEISEFVEFVKDFAVIGARPPKGGQDEVVVYAVINKALEGTEEKIKKLFRDAIKQGNPLLAKIDDVILVDEIPRNGPKIRHKELRQKYHDGYESYSAQRNMKFPVQQSK